MHLTENIIICNKASTSIGLAATSIQRQEPKGVENSGLREASGPGLADQPKKHISLRIWIAMRELIRDKQGPRISERRKYDIFVSLGPGVQKARVACCFRRFSPESHTTRMLDNGCHVRELSLGCTSMTGNALTTSEEEQCGDF